MESVHLTLLRRDAHLKKIQTFIYKFCLYENVNTNLTSCDYKRIITNIFLNNY